MDVMVWKSQIGDGYGKRYFDASTPEFKEESALSILSELVDRGRFQDPHRWAGIVRAILNGEPVTCVRARQRNIEVEEQKYKWDERLSKLMNEEPGLIHSVDENGKQLVEALWDAWTFLWLNGFQHISIINVDDELMSTTRVNELVKLR